MKTLLLIDAYAMIFRAYYAFIRAPRMNSKGENTSAIFGFCVTIEDLIKKVKPTHIAVAFDPQGKTFRHEAYPAYKAQREATPEDIRRAVPKIMEILEAMHITTYRIDGYEADDVIGTLAKRAESTFDRIVMATPDKDYGQLVTEKIHMYRARHTGGFEDMGPAEVCAKYGLNHQSQVIDLLALMGDASDNIPGCTGVGEKTAVKLIQEWGSIENMLAHSAEIKGALGEKIRTQEEQIRFSKYLVTICTEVQPLQPLSPDPFPQSASLRARGDSENAKDAGNEWEALALRERNTDALYALYEQLEFKSLMKDAPAQPKKRIETPKQPELTLDLFAQVDPLPSSPVKGEELDLFSQPATVAEYDTPENRLVAYLLNPELSFNPYKAPDMEALKANPALYKLYTDVELPLMPVLREMEQAGVRFDTALLKEAEGKLIEGLNQLERTVFAMLDNAPEGLNINSPKQVGELLFDVLKLDPKAKRGKNGAYSTSEEVLLGIKDRHPIVAKILEYRELKKLISTYITTLPTYIREDGKIHATYHQTVTATGRLSCSDPNLQNLPIRTERGKLIREAVIPDEGCLFLSADYSQIELRLLAHLSGDEALIHAFRSGQDIHAATAGRIFHKAVEDVTKDERRKAKTANFGIIYGISAFGLSQQLDCSRGEAKELIDGYFAAFPQVIAYIERQKALARERGYAETLFGRRRYLPDILSHNGTVRSFAERNAVNAPIQGTAADIIKIAMVRIAGRLKSEGLRAQMVMQVHDELNFNVPVAEVERVREIVVSEMQGVVALAVPLVAECGVGENWLEAH